MLFEYLMLEDDFSTQFINALEADRKSATHSSECNYWVIDTVQFLLKHRELRSQITLEQIIRGALNMALCLEHNKYAFLTAALIGQDAFDLYAKQSLLWYDKRKLPSYENRNTGMIPFFTDAAKGPLFIMSACMPNTLAVYFKYAQELDNNFIPESLPKGSTHFNLIEGSAAAKEFELKVINQEVKDLKETKLLQFLKNDVTEATEDYLNHSNSIWFSLFHRHGASGRARAQTFLNQINQTNDYDTAKKNVLEFLNNNSNGNTHPHSYRNMLLTKLYTSIEANYRDTSGKYNEILKSLSEAMNQGEEPIISNLPSL